MIWIQETVQNSIGRGANHFAELNVFVIKGPPIFTNLVEFETRYSTEKINDRTIFNKGVKQVSVCNITFFGQIAFAIFHLK